MSDELTNADLPVTEPTPAHAMFRDLDSDDALSAIGTKPKKQWRLTTQVVAALVMAVGAGSIYWMRQTGMKSGMAFGEQPVSFESHYTEADQRRFQEVLRSLELSDRRVQIAAAAAGSNPFFIGIVKEDPSEREAAERAEMERKQRAEAVRREAEARLNEITNAFNRIRLGTILYSSDPRASIDGMVVGVGDTVAELFTVKEILPQAVVLEADGKLYTITPQTHGPGVRR